jgi:hypothetical protein
VRSGQPIAARLAGPLLDPGWTPPFNISLFPPMMVRTLPFIEDPDLADPSYYSGELGVVSGIYATRHPNSMLYPNGGSLSGNARILADAVMMFRAGEHTDDIGVRSAHAAFHVPWVWNEFALVYTNGAYYLRAAAAKFPTTWWYVNGNMVHEQAEAVDTTIPGTFKIPFYYVTPQNLVIYPVLAAGAKTHDAKGNLVPQSPNKQSAGPINTFPYAAPGAPPWQMAVSPQ